MDDSLTDQMNNKVKTDLLNQLQKQDTDFGSILKDKNDRATVDQVLDPRTLIIIHKLI
jgi:serine/threonine-protein kinase RIO1